MDFDDAACAVFLILLSTSILICRGGLQLFDCLAVYQMRFVAVLAIPKIERATQRAALIALGLKHPMHSSLAASFEA